MSSQKSIAETVQNEQQELKEDVRKPIGKVTRFLNVCTFLMWVSLLWAQSVRKETGKEHFSAAESFRAYEQNVEAVWAKKTAREKECRPLNFALKSAKFIGTYSDTLFGLMAEFDLDNDGLADVVTRVPKMFRSNLGDVRSIGFWEKELNVTLVREHPYFSLLRKQVILAGETNGILYYDVDDDPTTVELYVQGAKNPKEMNAYIGKSKPLRIWMEKTGGQLEAFNQPFMRILQEGKKLSR